MKFENVWWKPRVKENSESRIKVEKLIEPNVSERYKEGVRRVFENRFKDVDVEESWTCFKNRILEVAESACGRRKIGRGKKGSGWWSESLKTAAKMKSIAW